MDRKTRNSVAILAVVVLTGLMASACSPFPTRVGCATYDTSADTASFAVGDSVYADCDEVD